MAIFVGKKLFALWKPVAVTPGKVHLCTFDTSKALFVYYVFILSIRDALSARIRGDLF
jgi:hypothetical protein